MARPNGTYPYETLIRHTPDGLAISHRTITLFDGREFIGDPMPLTGGGVTALKDPALTALAKSFSAAAVDALAASGEVVKQVETLTAERTALTAERATLVEQVATLETAVAALGTTEKGLEIAKRLRKADAERRKVAVEKEIEDLEAAAVEVEAEGPK